jgi:hypothetical protein
MSAKFGVECMQNPFFCIITTPFSPFGVGGPNQEKKIGARFAPQIVEGAHFFQNPWAFCPCFKF